MIDLDTIIAAFRRQRRVLMATILAFLLLALLYLLAATPLYTARTTILIDRQNSAIVGQLSTIDSVPDDEASVLSQIEILKSEAIGLAVIDELDLVNDPDFNRSGLIGAGLQQVLRWFSASGPARPEALQHSALSRLWRNTSITRMGRSLVIEIAYTSSSPDLSARITASLAEAYLTDKIDSRHSATHRTGAWLQERIDELRRRSLESDLTVQKFRADNGLFSSGDRLMSDQQLSELNSALIGARAETAKAEARYDEITEIIRDGRSDAVMADMLNYSVSNTLREKFLDLSRREADIVERLGPGHEQAMRLRAERRQYERLMFEELGRIAESYRAERDIARSRERNLAGNLEQATGVSTSANETQVQLRELQRESETYRTLYQTFLQRYQEAAQQQSFPVTEARIISRATPPVDPSHPKALRIFALALIAGTAAGGVIGAFREFRDRFLRTGDQVRNILGVEFLGIAPRLDASAFRPDIDAGEYNRQPRFIRKAHPIASHVVDHPLSPFAETLRNTKIAADLGIPGKACRVIGVVSVLPSEGKSTIAINFAELLASQGANTLLIDADLRNPGSTRMLACHAEEGLVEAVAGSRPTRDTLLFNPKTRLAFLPAVVPRRIPHSSELLSSAGMADLLAGVNASFHYVILDLPPLGPVVDARAIASRVDGFVFVVEWGRTATDVVQQALQSEQIAEKCLGVILNKVDTEEMKLYPAYGSPEYYYPEYARYYHR
ncbi:MAG: polysaccharide biosynthesis tyrosine autokinase [Shinella sp.]|nr:polysaccharide biosynthesis tyrosine autokinase [Shinella sp.]